VQHQGKGIPQGAHASSFLANLTCYHFEKSFVEKHPFHSIQNNIFRYCDNFQVANVPYFMIMYRDIYPESSGITLIPKVIPKARRKIESHFLDTLTYVTHAGEVFITLYDKRSSYSFKVNRFPDVATNASRIQSHSVFYGELVRMFRIDTHVTGLLQNSAKIAANLIARKNYCRDKLTNLFIRFIRS
jgi:hypothetical protein